MKRYVCPRRKMGGHALTQLNNRGRNLVTGNSWIADQRICTAVAAQVRPAEADQPRLEEDFSGAGSWLLNLSDVGLSRFRDVEGLHRQFEYEPIIQHCRNVSEAKALSGRKERPVSSDRDVVAL